ncbi:MAG: hypothetical protein AAFX41_07835 [Bacteroidota bacterium]
MKIRAKDGSPILFYTHFPVISLYLALQLFVVQPDNHTFTWFMVTILLMSAFSEFRGLRVHEQGETSVPQGEPSTERQTVA